MDTISGSPLEAILIYLIGPLAILVIFGLPVLIFLLFDRVIRKKDKGAIELAERDKDTGPLHEAVSTGQEAVISLEPVPAVVKTAPIFESPPDAQADGPVNALEPAEEMALVLPVPGEVAIETPVEAAPAGVLLESTEELLEEDTSEILAIVRPEGELLPFELVEEVLPGEVVGKETVPPGVERKLKLPGWVLDAALLILILAVGAAFRFTGLNWDEKQHLHPDERFITMTASAIHSVASLSHYFNTDLSSLNPFSTGSYTYGMFPLFLTRYVAEWLQKTPYDEITLVGRALSGLFDLAAVALLFVLAKQLYGRKVAFLATALASAAVLPIQLSHYFAVDTFSTVFVVAAFCVAVAATKRSGWWHYAAFGALTGMAMACKITLMPLLGVMALASFIQAASNWQDPARRGRIVVRELFRLFIAASVAALFFRIFQPYAFEGPGFFDVKFYQKWLDIIKEVQNQVSGRAEWPPNVHWTARPMLTYAWQNLTVWGVGLPLGLAATLGWLWAAWRCFKGDEAEWKRHLLPVAWVGGYFLWQNMQFWRYMRYFMPIYPLAILLAAWALVELAKRTRANAQTWRRLLQRKWNALPGALALLATIVVVVSAFCYAFAFTRIYNRPLTRVEASRWMLRHVPGPINVVVQTDEGELLYPLGINHGQYFSYGDSWIGTFTPDAGGTLVRIQPMYVMPAEGVSDYASLNFQIGQEGVNGPLVTASATFDLDARQAAPPVDVLPIQLEGGVQYTLKFEVAGGGPFSLEGSRLAIETAWDDALPLRLDGYDPFGNLYQLLDLRLYEPENQARREEMISVLDQADMIVISSNRSYDAMPRIPLRYPMTLDYYQALFDCPYQLIKECAYPAEAPMKGALGFDLVKTFESSPNLGPISFSDQEAEEAFTVYDHPKVLLFQKTDEFRPEQVEAVLGRADLDNIIELGPVQASRAPTALQMDAERRQQMLRSGTWSEMFDLAAAINQHPTLAAAAWYFLLFLLGWLALPLCWFVFRGLPDGGYPLARIASLIVIGWIGWVGGSLNLWPMNRTVLWLGALFVTLASGGVLYSKWREFKLYLATHRTAILAAELVFLALFLAALWVRWQNPDLWQPWRGGEKPMDFSYFNAVIKSEHFPPYDPWMSGNVLNYYYYGYVLAAVLTKMLGVAPSTAYNLVLPAWYAMTGLGVFSLAFNLVAAGRRRMGSSRIKGPLAAGVIGVLLVVCLGNLFQVSEVWNRLVEINGFVDPTRPWYGEIGDAFQGLIRVMGPDAALVGENKGDWYFAASRAILYRQEGTPITEFPLFTYLYGDMHPHMLDMPVTLAALGFLLSIVLAPGTAGNLAAWLLGGLVLGATYPTHTWDFVPLAGLAVAALAYSTWLKRRSISREIVLEVGLLAGSLLALSVMLYYPFRQWFGSDYVAAELWKGPRSPLADYLTVHGLFLFILVTFMFVLAGGWIRSRWQAFFFTPLGRLLPSLKKTWWRGPLVVLVAAAGFSWLWTHDYHAPVLAIPLLIGALLLMITGRRTPAERCLLGLVSAAIGLTAIVEVVVLKGDVGRSNTVFKFYLQVWLILSAAAGAGLVWLYPSLQVWRRRWIWKAILVILIATSALYPLTAIKAKVTERWPNVADPPKTLDGMAYMLGDGMGELAMYNDEGRLYDLSLDYGAMRWMQENVKGTPVIVEGQTTEYRWGSRFAVYTGLPTVVGWSWHLRQHNSVVPGVVVEKRIQQVHDFYNTTDVQQAMEFLRRYSVEYVIVGQMEQAYYAQEGLYKFVDMAAEGMLDAVYTDSASPGLITIYRTNLEY